MENIKITENNREMCWEFIRVKKGLLLYENASYMIKNIIAVILFLLIQFGFGVALAVVPSQYHLISFMICLAISLNGILGVNAIPKIAKKFTIQEFKKRYPDFDTNIDVNELEKELEKYDILSNIPNDIEKQQQEVISKYDDSFRNMNNEERIEYLERELEILQQAEYKSKYGYIENNEQENFQKKIGSIN